MMRFSWLLVLVVSTIGAHPGDDDVCQRLSRIEFVKKTGLMVNIASIVPGSSTFKGATLSKSFSNTMTSQKK